MRLTTNHRKYKNKKPLGIKFIEVIEIEYEVDDNPMMPKRKVKEYQKITGEYIGYLDPLDDFSSIISRASYDETSDET